MPAAVVISAGFREAGAEGQAREAELRAWAAEAPLRLIGPNCLGWIRPGRRLNLTFAAGMPPVGSLGFFSHSGALCTAILDWSREHGVGFSLFASLGNQADVNETDLIQALADDPDTRVILGYLEGVADGRAFFAALSSAAARKPCVLMKAGRSIEGARAVSSHTGALAGSDRAFDAAVRQAGALRVGTLEELFDVARALVAGRTPPGRRVILVTNGGGLGILATDAARDAGLDVAPLPASVQARLATVLPPHAATTNPVDLIGDATPSRYGDALHALAGESASLVVMLSPQAATDAAGVARAVLGATREWPAPVLGVFAGGARVRPGVTALEEAGVPCYTFPERAVQALGHTVALAERRRAPAATLPTDGVDRARLAGALAGVTAAQCFGLLEGAPLLAAYGIDVVPARLARSPAEAAEAARVPRRAGGDQDRLARDHAQDRCRWCRARTRLARGGGERHRSRCWHGSHAPGRTRAWTACWCSRWPVATPSSCCSGWCATRSSARSSWSASAASSSRSSATPRRGWRRYRSSRRARCSPSCGWRRRSVGFAAARPSTSRHWPTP